MFNPHKFVYWVRSLPFSLFMYRIAGNFRWVLIFAISRTVYGVVKIKTAIIYSNRYSNGRFIWNRENKNRKKLFHTLLPLNRKNFRSRKFPAIRYLKEKQYKIAMILLCPVQGPWASSLCFVVLANHFRHYSLIYKWEFIVYILLVFVKYFESSVFVCHIKFYFYF